MQHPMNDTAHIIAGTATSGVFAFMAWVLPAFQLAAAIIAIVAGIYAIDHAVHKRRLRIALQEKSSHQ